MGVSLLLQKRLASSVLKCGKRKIWLDPNEVNEISMANSRARHSPHSVHERQLACSPPRHGPSGWCLRAKLRVRVAADDGAQSQPHAWGARRHLRRALLRSLCRERLPSC